MKHAKKEIGDVENCFDLGYKYSYFCNYFSARLIPGSFNLDISCNLKGRLIYRRNFILVPQAMLPLTSNIYGRRSTIAVNECLPAAQGWIRSCLDKHEQCPEPTQPHTYPTRLLALGAHNCSLVLSQDHESLGPYAALSYCWGPNPSFLHLTADNVHEFRGGVPYSSLPIAFQEAILVIKELGIRYLWIDALCIIQSGPGSSEDW